MNEHKTSDEHAIALSNTHPHGDFWAAVPITNEMYESAPNHGVCACGQYGVADGIHWHVRGKCHTREKCDE